MIYLVLITPYFEKLVVNILGRKQCENTQRTKITLSEYNGWIMIFEETLILHSWVYHDKHPKAFFKGGRKSIICDIEYSGNSMLNGTLSLVQISYQI